METITNDKDAEGVIQSKYIGIAIQMFPEKQDTGCYYLLLKTAYILLFVTCYMFWHVLS